MSADSLSWPHCKTKNTEHYVSKTIHGTHRPQWDHRVDPGIRRKETKSLGVPPTLINIKSLRRLPNRTRDLSSSLRCDPCDSSESEQLKMHDHSGYNEIYRCPHLKTPKFFKIQDPCSPSRDNPPFQATTNLFTSSAFHRSIQFETKVSVNRLYSPLESNCDFFYSQI